MKRFRNILFVLDSSVDARGALVRAAELASNNQAALTIAGTVEPVQSLWPKVKKQVEKSLLDQCKVQLAELLADSEVSPAETKVLVGEGFVEIIRQVLEHGYDLVIKAVRHTDGVGGELSGLDLKLLRKCPCPIWMINASQKKRFRRVLGAVDFSHGSSDAMNIQILEMASAQALAEFSELHVVHAWDLPHEGFLRSSRSGFSGDQVDDMRREEKARRSDWLDDLVSRACRGSGEGAEDYLSPKAHLIEGDAGYRVPQLVTELGIDLIVMGTVGRTGIPGLLIGNTAEKILQNVQCSLLTVKPVGFISPVMLEG